MLMNTTKTTLACVWLCLKCRPRCLGVTVSYHGAIGGKPLKIDFTYTFKLARVMYPKNYLIVSLIK